MQLPSQLVLPHHSMSLHMSMKTEQLQSGNILLCHDKAGIRCSLASARMYRCTPVCSSWYIGTAAVAKQTTCTCHTIASCGIYHAAPCHTRCLTSHSRLLMLHLCQPRPLLPPGPACCLSDRPSPYTGTSTLCKGPFTQAAG